MLQLTPKKNVYRTNTTNPIECVSKINEHIDSTHCENMQVDISNMNVYDACYVSTMCSAKHFIKYPSGKINWIISSKFVAELNKRFDLGNSNYTL